MFVGTVRDISERKNAEQEIQQYLSALKSSNQELDDFAYIASHDLKEPLRGLSNNVTFLKEDYQDKIDADGHRRFDRMAYLCERMERLINDLLYFSRLGRQELAVQVTDLNEVISDIESMMESVLSEANVKIVIPEKLPSITCDLPRITEVFRNLITNAIKYNDKPEKRVEIGCHTTDGERVFYVRDNGIGIPSRFYNDVFRIFKRLNDEDDSVKGTGVGLTFVKKIIERHSGRIWIESEVGKGTTFYFTINEPQGA
jgi:two-component system, LuxR family, sensor kinase FixL